MAMSRSRQDVIYRALAELGALATGQTPEQDDVSSIDVLVDSVLDELSTRGLAFIADPGDVGPSGGDFSSDLFLPIASWLANVAAPSFGGTYSPDVEAALAVRIRDITAARPSYQPMQAEYF